MARLFRTETSEMADTEELDQKKFSALKDSTRREIIEKLSIKASYPSEIARELEISKQKAHYHFEKLVDAGLIAKDREEKLSGGLATFYRPVKDAFHYDLGAGGQKTVVGDNPEVQRFLTPLVDDTELDGNIVVGSPDQHGPDQVRARDGHLSAELGMKLGKYSESSGIKTVLDTEIVKNSSFDRNLLLLGGVPTNTVTRKFNDEFPASFSGEEFPYHEIETPEGQYSDDSIGLIAKTQNPYADGKYVFLVAGIRNRGTKAAVLGFKDLENLINEYEEGSFYRVVRGRDMDGDGEIDSYEVVE